MIQYRPGWLSINLKRVPPSWIWKIINSISFSKEYIFCQNNNDILRFNKAHFESAKVAFKLIYYSCDSSARKYLIFLLGLGAYVLFYLQSFWIKWTHHKYVFCDSNNDILRFNNTHFKSAKVAFKLIFYLWDSSAREYLIFLLGLARTYLAIYETFWIKWTSVLNYMKFGFVKVMYLQI